MPTDELHPLFCTCPTCDGPVGNTQRYTVYRRDPKIRRQMLFRLSIAAFAVAAGLLLALAMS